MFFKHFAQESLLDTPKIIAPARFLRLFAWRHFSSTLFSTSRFAKKTNYSLIRRHRHTKIRALFCLPLLFTPPYFCLPPLLLFKTLSYFYLPLSILLQQIDSIQSKFLWEIGISDVDAIFEYNLALLDARRDMGMLGFVHRTVFGFNRYTPSTISNSEILRYNHREGTLTRDTTSNYKLTEEVNS